MKTLSNDLYELFILICKLTIFHGIQIHLHTTNRNECNLICLHWNLSDYSCDLYQAYLILEFQPLCLIGMEILQSQCDYIPRFVFSFENHRSWRAVHKPQFGKVGITPASGIATNVIVRCSGIVTKEVLRKLDIMLVET